MVEVSSVKNSRQIITLKLMLQIEGKRYNVISTSKFLQWVSSTLLM